MIGRLKKLKSHGWASALLTATILLLTAQAWAAEDFVRRPYPSAIQPKYAANQVLITLQQGYTEADLAAMNAAYGSRVVRRLSGGNTFLLDLPGAGAPSEAFVANETGIRAKYPCVADVEFNHAYRPLAKPTTDEYYPAYYDVANRLRGQWPLQPDPLDSTIQHIYAPEGWDLQKGSSDVIVAVIDTGIRISDVYENNQLIRTPHPDLVNRLILDPAYVIGPYGLIPPDTGMWDMNPAPPETDVPVGWMHGTMCAGLIGAQGDNGMGITGLCWNGVRILAVKAVNDADSLFYADALYEALEYVIRYRDTRLSSKGEPLRVNVVNMSLGGHGSWPSLLVTQVKRAVDCGIVVVAAAGNDWDSGAYPPTYPGALEEVICVGSTDSHDIVSTFSQRGRTLDLVAPGEDVSGTAWSRTLAVYGPSDPGDPTDPGNGTDPPPFEPPGGQAGGIGPQAVTQTFPDDYGNYITEFASGTSFAAPLVSGAAALLISHGVPARDVKQILCSTATPIGFGRPNDSYGWGLLNVRKALEKASIEVQIQSPVKSSIVTSSRPKFRIDFRHALETTIEVWLDKGTPGQVLLIGGPTARIQDWDDFYFTLDADAGKTYLLFDYPVSSGAHTITASAQSDIEFAPAPPIVPAGEDTGNFVVRPNTLNPGWHMFSVPYSLDPSVTPESVVGTSAQLWRYAYPDGEIGGYAAYSAGGRMDNEATFQPRSAIAGALVRPIDRTLATSPAGLGYWLKVRNAGLSLPGLNTATATEVGSAPYVIGLYEGWNMVGCPYVSPTSWQTAMFDFRGVRLSAQDAVAQGLISNTIYSYNPITQAYTTAPISSATMQPWQAQWIRVKPQTSPSTAPHIYNKSFQDGFFPVSALNSTGTVGSNWSAFTTIGTGRFSQSNPGATDTSCQRVVSSLQTGWFSGGIYQQVAVTPGERYTFSAWTKRLMNCTAGGTCRWPFGEGTQIGIDPTGGLDPLAVSVVWTPAVEGSVGQWTQQIAYTQAEQEHITVFVRILANNAGADRVVYIDDANIAGGPDVNLIVTPGYTSN